MTEAQGAALRLAGRLMSYPNPDFIASLPALKAEAESMLEQSSTEAFARTALDYITLLQMQDVALSAQRYVAIFDHTPSASLYMTWHRYGNDRSQGQAMAALNGLYRTAGFEPIDGDMPDYLPRMLEFLSIAPDWACDALLDGFGPEMGDLLATLKDLGADQANFLEKALEPLRQEYRHRFAPRTGPDPTKRQMARPEPEPLKPIIPVPGKGK